MTRKRLLEIEHGAVATDTKLCRICGKTKVAGEFYAHAGHTDGLSSYCKACTLERKRQRRKADTDAILLRPEPDTKHIFDALIQAAKSEFRTPEMQVLYWLDCHLTGRRTAAESLIIQGEVING